MRDHLAAASCSVVTQKGVTRVIGTGINSHFGDENPELLIAALNSAAEKAFRHYEPLNKNQYLTQDQLSTLSVNVAVHFLYIYSNWKDTKLVITAKELAYPGADDECYQYCKKLFGFKFRPIAAKLMGMSISELRDFEIGREWKANR